MDIVTLAAAKKYTDDKLISSGNSGAVVDSTLTTSGAAADAKVTGDKIKELNNKFDNIELPDVPTKVSELDNDSKFITEKYYLDNREFYDDITFDNVFTLQTILDPNGFKLTAKNDSFDFFNSLSERYKSIEYSKDTWYVVDRLVTRYDKGEWLSFESGDDILVLAKIRDDSRCQFEVINKNTGEWYLRCEGKLRDSEGNISYDWGEINLNTKIIPIPDISGLSTINLDFEFYDSTSEIKKIDNKFIDIPTIAQEAAKLVDTALLSILGDGVIE
jgi:hypothetical protein